MNRRSSTGKNKTTTLRQLHSDAVLLVNYLGNLPLTPAGLYAKFWTAMQALLFCQDENSARVLIPLVQGLDIVVMHETEVFSAMRTLMAERFDFLIIDYKDEQTGRILLKNARSSANRTALAVAVVNPETGANALRLGADFLVTRPINLGQAGGVLRLVRSAVLRQKVLPTENASKAAAAEPFHLPQETAVSPHEPNTAISNGLLTVNLSLTDSLAVPSAQSSVEGISAERVTLSSGPVEPANETANLAIDAMTVVRTHTEHEQDRNVTETDEESREDRAIVLASPALDATPEALPKNAAARGENKPRRRFLVSMVALAAILLIMAAILWHMRTENSSAKMRAIARSAVANSPAQSTANTSEPAAVTSQAASESQTEGLTTQVPANQTVGSAPLSIPQVANTQTPQAATKSQSSLKADLAPLTATVSLNSDPANAAVWMDGKDTGRSTPAQISVDKSGTHNIIFKKQGYLDETATANLRIGQTFDFAPRLRPLGRTDEIKMVGTFRRILGGGEEAGQGIVSVKTEPKGAQIAVNGRTISKPSPARFYLNPGNYAIDITIAGFKVIHRVVSVDKGGTTTIDQVLDPQ